MTHRWIALLFVIALAAASEAASGEPVALDTGTGILNGTLELPEAGETWPAVLIVAGSGPTDRDGNNPLAGENNSLRMLAEGMAARGIASLRYDKRGIAASQGAASSEEDLRFEMYVDDAASWCEWLKGDDRFDDLMIAGHSEGSQIGALAAKKTGAAGFISIAGPGFPAADVIVSQLETRVPQPLFEASLRIIDDLRAGKRVEEIPPELVSLFRPSVQPYMISWFRYDPAEQVAELEVPMLIVHGSTDLQISMADAERLAAANPAAELVVLEGVNHVLKEVEGDLAAQIPSYGDPALPVAPALIERMANFVLAGGGNPKAAREEER